MTSRRPHRDTSGAVLIGVGTYDRAERLAPIPAAANNIDDLHRLLTRPEGALEPGTCRAVADPAGVAEVGDLIRKAAEHATDTLIVYYTGHGLLDSRGRLHLGLPHTDPDLTPWTALSINVLREAIAESPARTRILILDCCFSGRAMDAMTGGFDAVLGQTDITGTYTITSSARTEPSYAPPGHRNTAFTAALLEAATRHPDIALDDLYLHIQHHLRRNSHPEPRRRADDNAGRLVLFPSAVLAAPQPAPHPDPAPPVPPPEPEPEPDPAPRPRVSRRSLLIGLAVGVPVTAATAAGVAALRSPSTRFSGRLDAVLTGHTASVDTVAFSPDGALLATAGKDKTARVWDARTRQPSGEPIGHSGWVGSVAFSPDGTLLATAADGMVRLWDPRTRQPMGEPLIGHNGWIGSVAFSPDGTLLATAGRDDTARLWDPATRRQVGEPLAHSDWVASVCFSPDGAVLATACDDHAVRLWDPRSGRLVGEPLIGHSSWIGTVAFNRDGSLLVTTSGDTTVRLWDPRTRQPVGGPLTGHTDWVYSAAFSPDGTLLATAGKDRTVRLWDPRTRRSVGAPLDGHSSWVGSLAFNRDGTLLATGSEDTTVGLWK